MAERILPSLLPAGFCLTLLLGPLCTPSAAAASADPSSPSANDAPLESVLAAENPPLGADDRRRLATGEPVVRMDPAGPPAAGTGWRVLAAPAERLYRAVADWSHYAEFFPFVLASEVTAESDGTVAVRQRIDLPFPWPDRRFAATTERGAETTANGRSWRVAWNLVPGSGNVEANRGEWRLRELAPGRTLVALHLVSDAGAVPTAVQREALERTLPWALDGLRQQVNRCRYDLPIAATCAESPPWPAVEPSAEPTADDEPLPVGGDRPAAAAAAPEPR